MKKMILVVGVCMFAAFFLVSAEEGEKTSPSLQEVDINTGAALNIDYGITITTFDGETVNWRAESSLFNKESKRVYVPAGGHTFVAKYGLKTKKFEEYFVVGGSYLVGLNPSNKNMFFEKLR